MSLGRITILIALVAAALMLLWQGERPTPPQKVSCAPAASPPPQLPKPADVPVVYDRRLFADKLSDELKEEIIRQAAPLTPKGQRIWYIHSDLNRASGKKPDYRTTVYFTPHVATPRLRKGQRVAIICGALPGGFRKVPEEKIKELLKTATDEDRQYYEQIKARIDDPLFTWWQVSLKEQPFGQRLDAPGEDRLWPMSAPHGFADEEVIEIVDFIRTAPDSSTITTNADGTFTVSGFGRVDAGLPIMSIYREKDGSIGVTTGSVQAPLAGSGQMIRIKREGDTYRVTEVSQWVS